MKPSRILIASVVLVLCVAAVIISVADLDKGDGAASLIIISPGSTEAVLMEEGRRSAADVLSGQGRVPGAGPIYAYTSDQDLIRVQDGASITVRDGVARLSSGQGLEALAWSGGERMTTLMSVASTASTCLSLYHPSNEEPLVRAGVERVVALEIDGLGWEMLKGLADRGILKNITGLGNAGPALTAYPPITNVGTAMALTGRPPAWNGIIEREGHFLREPTFLETAGSAGFTTAHIEGPSRFLNIDLELHVDLNGNGDVDDEIHAMLLEEIENGTDVVLAHYHSVDDAGHEGFALDEGLGNASDFIDRSVGEVVSMLSDTSVPTLLILFSDHGMHASNEGGEHGEYSHEDLFAFTAWRTFGDAAPLDVCALEVEMGERTMKFDLPDLMNMTATVGTYAVRSSTSNGTHVFTGVEVATLLEAAGAGAGWTSLEMSASDGYALSVPGEWAAPGSGLMIAYAVDGRPLVDDGPLRLIVPQTLAGEYNGQFCLKSVSSVEVV